MADERSGYTDRVLDTGANGMRRSSRLWRAVYPLCLVMVAVALIVVILFTTADLVTAIFTVAVGLGLALVLH